MNFKRSLLNILFWSVVSAAFIGPGTITTAAKSGSLFGTDLLWALLFSTFACLILQEAAARLTILSGKNLGEAIREITGSPGRAGFSSYIIGISIYTGAVAYETGNLIGAREGLQLVLPGKSLLFIVIIGAVSGLILFIPSLKIIARIMGVMVMILGIAFLVAAIRVMPPLQEVAGGLFRFRIPANSQGPLLILGLIGTTIVPYNLFLGSGLTAPKTELKSMRTGLSVSIILGGIFSMAVLIVGTVITDHFGFSQLAGALGKSGTYLLGTGLFAAGFTSGITAPLAAAITLRSLFGNHKPGKWANNGIYFRASWLIVLITGLFFAVIELEPIPAIILAQALNGLILPLVSFFLAWLINMTGLTGKPNSNLNNFLLGITLAVSLSIGMKNLITAIEKLSGTVWMSGKYSFTVIGIFSVVITTIFMIYIIQKNRNAGL